MKTLISHRYTELSKLFILSILSLSMIAIRIKITRDFYMLFLVWNLFLALIPYMISLWYYFMINHISTKSAKWLSLPILIVWLLFLPNAPYIITDLIHIRGTGGSWLIYDCLLISCFAITGCWAGFKSLELMLGNLNTLGFIKNSWDKFIGFAIIFLSSLGIYLGRELRWNSWDIIQHPGHLFEDIFSIFTHPYEHLQAWLQIGSMSIFLMALFYLFYQHEKK